MMFPEGYWAELWGGFIGSLVFGLLGLLLILLGFKLFDWVTPRIDIQRELAEKSNIAVAIVCAAAILGVSIFAAIAVK
jgi:putative membrane protein